MAGGNDSVLGNPEARSSSKAIQPQECEADPIDCGTSLTGRCKPRRRTLLQAQCYDEGRRTQSPVAEQGSHMDKKRVIAISEHNSRAVKLARTMQEAPERWEWPVLHQQEKQMLPYWVFSNTKQQQSSKNAAAPAASLGETRDTLSLGNWAHRQVSLELSLGAGHGSNGAGSPDCDIEDADIEDTAASSCSESSGWSARQSGDNSSGQEQQEPKQHTQLGEGEDDSITSNQPPSAPSAAFSFGCLPVVNDGLEVNWPVVEVGAQ